VYRIGRGDVSGIVEIRGKWGGEEKYVKCPILENDGEGFYSVKGAGLSKIFDIWEGKGKHLQRGQVIVLRKRAV